MINERRKSGQTFNDVVDMCIEWYDKLDSPEFKQAKITELTICCQALVFFFGGQGQLSTMISTTIYHMTQDPEIERKIYNEVDSVFAKHNGKIEHEHLSELVYLNACISEALRLYPNVHRFERTCSKDWVNEEYGLHVKKGMTIQFPIWAINRCDEYNSNGEKYEPERFMPGNRDRINPYASSSFGQGKMMKDTKLVFIPGGPAMTFHEPIYVDVMERQGK